MPKSRPDITFVETRTFARRIVALGLEGALRELRLVVDAIKREWATRD